MGRILAGGSVSGAKEVDDSMTRRNRLRFFIAILTLGSAVGLLLLWRSRQSDESEHHGSAQRRERPTKREKKTLPVPTAAHFPGAPKESRTYSELEEVTLGSISGRLIDTEGNVVQNWQEPIAPVGLRLVGKGDYRSIDIRGDGSYEVDALPEGTYSVMVEGWELNLPGRYYCFQKLPQNVAVGTSNADIVLTCGNPGRVRGTVLDVRTMQPVTKFAVLHRFDFGSALDRSRQCALFQMMRAGARPRGALADIAYFKREYDRQKERLRYQESLGPDVNQSEKRAARHEFYTLKVLLESQRLEVESEEGVFDQSGYLLGKHTFTVMADGFPPNSVDVELKDGNPAQLTFLMREQGSAVTGKVQEGSGKPVKGAVVTIRVPTNTDYYYMWEASPNWETLEFITDESGEFAFANLPDGMYEASAFHGDFPAIAKSSVRLVNGRQEPSDVFLQMFDKGDGSIWGQITGSDGSPLAGVGVRVSSSSLVTDCTTHSDGYYAAGQLPPGGYVMAVDRGELDNREYLLSLGPSQQLRYDINLRGSATLKGTIDAGGGGKLASWLRLSLRSDRLIYTSQEHQETGMGRASYEFRLLPPGQYELDVLTDMFDELALKVSLTPNETAVLDINLGQHGNLKGMIIGRDGNLVAGVPLSVISPGRELNVRSDSEGRYSVADLSPGYIHLIIPEGKFKGTWYEFELKKEQDKECDIDFSTTGDVKGQILQADGTPLGRAVLRVESPHRSIEVIGDPEGRFRAEAVFPGYCRIHLPVPHLGRAFSFELAPKEDKDIQIILPP